MNPFVHPNIARWRAITGASRRLVSVLTSVALVLSVAVGIGIGSVLLASDASAVPAPPSEPGAGNVTADALPTVQIDGVVWSQDVVGNTVYAGGSFANARPAGAAPGTSLTPRGNLLAYNITTGALVTSFAPSLNAAVRAVAASPDGSRVYVGGSFTVADGQQRYRLAAYSTATGQLISSFAPVLDYDVNAIVATNTTVYVGGGFSSANNVARGQLAAFSATDGSLLGWAPTADNHEVEAMVMAPGGGKIIVGGSFTSLNGSTSAYGMGALDATTGALLPWAATSVVRDAGDSQAILNLSADNNAVYGSGYDFVGGGFEGTFSLNPANGAINWLEDCHGDTYSTFPMGNAVYTVSHSHYCGNVGGFPQPEVWVHHHALAFSTNATGTLLNDSVGYPNFGGQPSPTMLNWFPDMDPGTYTGQSQAAWNVSGNSQYIVLGGEFPTVNGAPQQGLVRFGVPAVATNKQAPMDSGSDFVPTLRAVSSTSVRVSWPANWDRDDETLTYHVVRNGDTNHPIRTMTAVSQFWNRPTLGYVDKGLSPGTSYDYRLNVVDSDGHVVWGDTASITTPTTTPSNYAQQIPNDNAASYWRFGEASGNTASDSSGADNLTEGSGVVEGAAGAIVGDADTAATFSGSSSGTSWTANPVTGPNTYSLEAWFKTTTTRGGKIIGFGSSQGASSVTDRQVYMDNAGHLVYGVWQNGNTVVSTPSTYNDGNWHQVVATLSPAGMVLYVDGAQAAANASVTTGRPYYGYWRVGGDSLSGWPSAPSSGYFAGTLDEVAVYPTAMSLATVQNHYVLSGRSLPGGTNKAPTAAFTNSCTGLACSFNGSSSSDSDGTIAAYAWTFGDNTTGTGATPSHTYAAAGTYTVTLTVTDDKGATGSVSQSVTVEPVNSPPTGAFTTSCTNLACSFDGSGSNDTDGSIASYAWIFGDNGTGTGATSAHTYATGGTYNVTLTVTDNKGATDSVSHTVTVSAPNSPPTASFTSSCTNLACSLNGTGSKDTDGSIASYAWTYGDNTTGTGATPTHTYAAGGTYTVTLTVTDDKGATNSVSHTVTVVKPRTLTASFTSSCTNLACSFDGSSSTAASGRTISRYAWTYGDAATGSGAKVSHTYAAAGTYTVKLTVTDNRGSTASKTKSVTVSAATAPPVISDDFQRTVSSGWGAAPTGGAWTVDSPQLFAVTGGQGTVTLNAPGAGPTASLGSVSQTNLNVLFDTGLNKAATGNGALFTLMVRKTANGDYRFKVRYMSDGTVHLIVSKVVAGNETTLQEIAVPGLTYTAGQMLRARLKISGTGPTTITGKVWQVGATEPAAAQITVTDTEAALQGAGSVALQTYLAGNATNAPIVGHVDNLTATNN